MELLHLDKTSGHRFSKVSRVITGVMFKGGQTSYGNENENKGARHPYLFPSVACIAYFLDLSISTPQDDH